MCWVLITCGILLLASIVIGIATDWFEFAFGIFCVSWAAPLAIAMLSCSIISDNALKVTNPIRYQNNEIIRVDESNYYLQTIERISYWDWHTKVTEYKLYNRLSCKLSTKNKNEIIAYFEPENNVLLKGDNKCGN